MGERLADIIRAAAEGTYPPTDGGWERLETWREGLECIVAFTAHAYLVLDPSRSDDSLAHLQLDGLGGAHHPAVVSELAGPGGWISSIDALLARRVTPTGREPLVRRDDLANESRALYASSLREATEVLGYRDSSRKAVAIVGCGVGGLPELSYELERDRRGRGEGLVFVESALSSLPTGELLLAAVAPGNVASLRVLLRAGFAPIASVQLFKRARTS